MSIDVTVVNHADEHDGSGWAAGLRFFRLAIQPIDVRSSGMLGGIPKTGGTFVSLSFFVLLTCAVLTSEGPGGGALSDSFTNWRDHPAIQYVTAPTTDPVRELSRQLEQGQTHLEFEGPSGYLRSTLKALNVPVESQIVVFAKDSLQAARINQGNPRAIFFNDSVAVGWVRGGLIELAAQDPRQSVVFYTLDQTPTGAPQFSRRDNCLGCHYTYSTVGVPGMLLRSAGQFVLDHRTPLDQRWGGWYVTGQHGAIRHLGNAAVETLSESSPSPDTLNWPSLEGKFDTTGYLSSHSDIVALMVFAHQMHMMNLLSRMGWEARVAEYQMRAKVLPPRTDGEEGLPIRVRDAAREVVDYMLFVDEAPLADTIHGSTTFSDQFAGRGPWDRQGRSLRQLDLERRLMRYPCSYMIYSPLFDRLPHAAKNAIYQRLWQILSGGDSGQQYSRLTVGDRAAIVGILRDTKQDLPDFFQPVTH